MPSVATSDFWLELWFDVSIVIIQAYHSNLDIRIHSLELKQEIINDRWCIEWMWVGEIEQLMKMELVEKNGILVDRQDILDVME